MKKAWVLALVTMAFGGPVSAQSFGVGDLEGGGGLVSVTNGVGRGAFLSGRVGIAELWKGVELQPEVTLWSTSRQIGDLAVTDRDLVVSATFKYWFSEVSTWRPYVGGGLGWNSVSTNATHPRFGEASVSEKRLGGHVFGGARYKLTESLGTFGELRYAIVSQTNHLSVWAGLSYRLR